ncbi:hypothetical protein MANES_18G031400v8 [Manihot esculenta]|uniref:Uncharacterized protein n=1 Tax=Manihot esculenta TaxID=3983 RepID=A0ACB7FX72_MANES|nr:hypothetical protein MANES_18G031400v8 [Manihot esculenta]
MLQKKRRRRLPLTASAMASIMLISMMPLALMISSWNLIMLMIVMIMIIMPVIPVPAILLLSIKITGFSRRMISINAWRMILLKSLLCFLFPNMSFCWNCDDESHRPVDCETVKKWISKNQSESENVNYILTYCKPCPNCRRPIEKNQGCMHMTCRVCMYSFCWLCLAPYENHGQCNGYLDNAVRKKEMAKQSLEKYTHYFERWDANRKSKLKALADFQHIKDVKFKRLSEIQGIPEDNMDFITKAWLQVVECRRVLEWSYAYGYYLPENELAKKQFFEYLQGEAESRLEKLHDCAEKELEQFLDSDGLSKDFIKFRTMLLTLTVVTGDYFEKLVRVLENGLSDVVSHGASSSPEEAEDYWFCDLCTYANPGSVLECQMCVSLDEDEV